MADKTDRPVIQIVLPPPPNPKDFSMAFGNPITDAAHFQLALTAWQNVSLASIRSASGYSPDPPATGPSDADYLAVLAKADPSKN